MAKDTDEGGGFSDAEKAAMKERAAEVKRRKGTKKQDPLEALQEKIAEMPDADRALAEGIHEIVTEVAPQLQPKTWYGMPAYALDGKNVVFFQSAAKFDARYATLGFEQRAELDDGDMWPTAFALTALTPEVRERIAELLRRAVG